MSTATESRLRAPGPSGMKLYVSLARAPRDWLGFLSELANDYGDIAFFRVLRVPVCFINRPDYIEAVLGSDFRHVVKAKDYAPLKAIMGEGLVTSEGEHWRRQRQLVVGNLRLDQQPRAAGDTKQLADRPAAAAGDRERSLAAGPVQCGDQLLPRSVRRAHSVWSEAEKIPRER